MFTVHYKNGKVYLVFPDRLAAIMFSVKIKNDWTLLERKNCFSTIEVVPIIDVTKGLNHVHNAL